MMPALSNATPRFGLSQMLPSQLCPLFPPEEERSDLMSMVVEDFFWEARGSSCDAFAFLASFLPGLRRFFEEGFFCFFPCAGACALAPCFSGGLCCCACWGTAWAVPCSCS